MGIVTARDHISISFNADSLLSTATEFRDSNLGDEDVCEKLGIPSKKGWNVANARTLIRQEDNLESLLKPIDYRPFDRRLVFYHRSLVWGMSLPTMQHVLDRENIGISTTRSIETGHFQHVFCSKHLNGHHFVSLKEVNHFFPLWRYPKKESLALEVDKSPNLNPEFMKAFASVLQSESTNYPSLSATASPMQIFSYSYAVLHSTVYRRRYEESLKSDFARVPLISNLCLFHKLIDLGDQLVSWHSMETDKTDENIAVCVGAGMFQVEKTTYSDNTVWIDKAKT